MSLEPAIRDFFRRFEIPPSHLVIAISGGTDSTALLLALLPFQSHGYSLTAAHVNHQLRGEHSAADEKFVSFLCAEQTVPLHVEQAPLRESDMHHRGIEAAAREIRYTRLQELRERIGGHYLLTAHHQRDQAETFLLRAIRGGGGGSLQGIRPVTRDRVLRPLLYTARPEIERFLEGRGVVPQQDESNASSRFSRNRIRSELLPMLSTLNPRAVENLARTAEQLREQQELLEPWIEEATQRWVERGETESRFNMSSAPSKPWLIRTILLREIHRLEPSARDVGHLDLMRICEELPALKRTSITRDLELIRNGQQIVMQRRRG